MPRKDAVIEKLDDLERIEGVAAVPPGVQESIGTSSNVVRPAGISPRHMDSPDTAKPGRLDPMIVLSLPDEDLDTFREAGWVFIEQKPGDRKSDARAIFRDGDGHVKIDTGNLNVRFVEQASTNEIKAVLHEHGLLIRRQLGFAPNLFTVGPETGHVISDSLVTARSLSSSKKVEYAEPVLIEALGAKRFVR